LLTHTDISYAIDQPSKLASYLSNLAQVDVIAGGAVASTVTLTQQATNLLAVLAIVTATGAFATKALLAVTTDYTLGTNGQTITFVTNQSANTLIFIYK